MYKQLTPHSSIHRRHFTQVDRISLHLFLSLSLYLSLLLSEMIFLESGWRDVLTPPRPFAGNAIIFQPQALILCQHENSAIEELMTGRLMTTLGLIIPVWLADLIQGGCHIWGGWKNYGHFWVFFSPSYNAFSHYHIIIIEDVMSIWK